MPYIIIRRGGAPQVQKAVAFSTLLEGTLPPENKSFRQLFDEMDAAIRLREPRVSREALSNVHGDWFEWLLAIAAWNYCAAHPDANLAMPTPNILRFDVGKLYEPRLYDLIQDLRQKVLDTSQVELISSNPDFVIIRRALVDEVLGPLTPVTEVSQETIDQVAHTYRFFEDQCDFEDIRGYISSKFSLRPDRRLQIPHEGSLMKAIYTHLQTREWIINPPGIKYFAIAARVGTPDRDALKTVATHSITTVHSIPQAAVDEVYEVNSLQQAQVAFREILHA